MGSARDLGSASMAKVLTLVEEEEELLERVQRTLAASVQRQARLAPSELRSLHALRELQVEARTLSEDDLPTALLELSVRQKLIERGAAPALPDPSSPYLAHLRFEEEDGTRRDYLLGHATLVDAAHGVRIVDWRHAPVARIFYRYREGDAFDEEIAGREISGTVVARRLVVIERGVLTRVLSDELSAERVDGRWHLSQEARRLAEGGAGTAARGLGTGVGTAGRAASVAVTGLLDARQYEAIHADPCRPLLVLGSAGSGKTTVALHRLVQSASTRPDAVRSVVVPEEGLCRLARRLLSTYDGRRDDPPVAEVETLDRWARRLSASVFAKRLRPSPETPALVAALKRHPALYRALMVEFTKRPKKRGARPSRDLRVLRATLADLFTDRSFLGAVVDDARGELPRTVIEATVAHTLLQLAAPIGRELVAITDASKKRAVDGRRIDAGTPEELAGTLDFEDFPILLFARARTEGLTIPPVDHLVVDEAEDVSLFELDVLGRARRSEGASLTVAGDEAQRTSFGFHDWESTLRTLRAEDAAICRLTTSYRCPRPITELAQAILGPLASPEMPTAAREGAPVGHFHFPVAAEAELFVATNVVRLWIAEPEASIAVLLHDEAAADAFFPVLADVEGARRVRDGAFSFTPGIDVVAASDAKGLEFDYVIVPDANEATYPPTDEARRRLHVAATRASHQLWMVSSGKRTSLLPPA